MAMSRMEFDVEIKQVKIQVISRKAKDISQID